MYFKSESDDLKFIKKTYYVRKILKHINNLIKTKQLITI